MEKLLISITLLLTQISTTLVMSDDVNNEYGIVAIAALEHITKGLEELVK